VRTRIIDHGRRYAACYRYTRRVFGEDFELFTYWVDNNVGLDTARLAAALQCRPDDLLAAARAKPGPAAVLLLRLLLRKRNLVQGLRQLRELLIAADELQAAEEDAEAADESIDLSDLD
jgi:hypothetical protein